MMDEAGQLLLFDSGRARWTLIRPARRLLVWLHLRRGRRREAEAGWEV